MDLNPIDILDQTDLRWLHALIWPEHEDRRILLDKALTVRKRFDLEMFRGDAVERLGSVVDRIPASVTPVVFHTFVANQLSPDSKAKLLSEVERIGGIRDIVHLHNHIEPCLHVTVFAGGRRIDIPLANIEGHARWVEWLERS
jgi:hypothetical protein